MVSRTRSTARQGRRGVAATELAVLLPFLGFLFVVAVDFARVFYYTVILNNCARNGAYYAADYPGIYGYGSAQAAAEADGTNVNPSLGNSNVTIMYSSSPAGPFNQPAPINNGFVQVTVNSSFSTITNYPGVPSNLSLSRPVVMRVAPIVPSNFP